ncbi:MAG: hypothetical protein RI955_2007 [Bacteroidota bacterium]
MTKKITLFTIYFLLIFSFQLSFAQSGFIGKKHEIGIDFYSPIFNNMYNCSYKYSYKKGRSFLVNLGHLKKHSDKLNNSNNLDTYVPAADFNGIITGLGILWNSKNVGMNMPIGYYTGFNIDFIKGKLTNIIPKYQLNEEVSWTAKTLYSTGYYTFNANGWTNSQELHYNFNVSGYNFNLYYGKNIYLFKNICLDVCLKTGFGYYRYKPNNFTAYPGNLYYDIIACPKRVGIPNEGGYTVYDNVDDVYYVKTSGFNLMPNMYPQSIFNYINSSGGNLTKTDLGIWNSGKLETARTLHKFKFIFYPQIKLCYLF